MIAAKEARSTDLVKAAGWMGLALLSFALLAVSARSSSHCDSDGRYLEVGGMR